MTLLKQLNKEVEDYKTKQVQIVPGLTFNQYDIINRIHHYYNSKFSGGNKGRNMDPIDDDGDRMYFYNIVKNPVKVFSKAVDFDTKNIRLLTTGGGSTLKTWFMERALKFWMRDKKFGQVLNRIFRELPVFGSVVLKIVDGFPEFVDLRNFVVEMSADNLDSTNYITEIHNYTVADFRAVGKQMNWEQSKIDETVKKFREMKNVSHIRVYERYGEIPTDPDASGDKKYEYKRIYIADVGVDEFDQYDQLTVPSPGVILKEDAFDGHPYWEFHAEKMPGRWLGIGVVETLFEPQIRQNELANLQTKTSYWSALRVFQTRDPAVARNLLTETRNGEVLTVDSEITQVDMSDRNLAFFNEEHNKWQSNRDELTFSFDVVQGQRLPAGTPLGSARLAASQTLTYFEQIQEEIAMRIKQLLYEVIIPQFEKENSGKHTIRLVGDDLDQFASMITNTLVFKEVVRLGLKGKLPSNEEKDVIEVSVREAIKQGKERLLDVPKGYYKDVKYDVDIDITGESVDTRVRSATIFAILQAVQADPTMLSDPNKRALLTGFAEDGGVNLHDYLPVEEKTVENLPAAGPGGGGVSAPALAGSPVAGQSQQTV